MSFFAAAAVTLGARVLAEIAVGAAESLRPGASHDIVTWGGSFALAHLFVLFLVVRVWAPEDSLRAVLAVRRVGLAACGLAALAGAAMYPPLARADAWLGQRFPLSPDEQEHVARMLDTSTRTGRVGLLVTVALVLPIVSEIFFRGAVYGRLRRDKQESAAAFATTAYFVLASFDPRTMASLLALGTTATWLRARTGSVVPALFAHVAFFAVPVAPMLAGRELVDDGWWDRRWTAGGAAVALIALAVVFAGATRSEACRVARARDG